MPILPPLTSSAGREMKRPRPIPPKLREAIGLMVYGHPEDPDCRAFTFIEAAHEMGAVDISAIVLIFWVGALALSRILFRLGLRERPY